LSESSALGEILAANGEASLRQAIKARLSDHANRGLEYAIYDRHGKFLLGSLPNHVPPEGWSRITAPPDGDEEPGENEYLEIFAVRLPNGERLAVGNDLNQVDDLGEVILRAFGWSLAASITLAILGGILLSGLFLRRIDTMTRAAETIIEGDIHHRLAVRHTNDDLDRLANTLNRMLDRICALMETTRQVTNDIAHDLRTPIGRLRQSLEEARRTSTNASDLDAAIERAIGESDSILETFAALLRIAQIESGSRKAGFREVKLSELVENVVQTFVPFAEDNGQLLTSDVEWSVQTHGDRELLTQMVVNLVENALVHTAAQTQISVSLTGQENPVLAISDTGPGIPEPERNRIFQRFYRADPSRTSSGNGLGLTLVAAIAELHGIAIEVKDNQPGLRMVLHFLQSRPQ
jgi:signal transduction histidine kinase